MGTPSIHDRLIRRFLERETERLLRNWGGRLRILDVGCGAMPYQDLFSRVASAYVGVDVEFRGAHDSVVVADATWLPFRSACWDVVVATEVVEHLADVGIFMREARRILGPDGLVVLSWPFVHPLHEIPNDFRRLTEFGMLEVVKAHGFEFEIFERRGNLLLTMWAMWSNTARNTLLGIQRRLGRLVGRNGVCEIALWFLGLLDRGAIAMTEWRKPSTSEPGEALRGVTGMLEGLPLGYCAVLKRAS